MAQRLQFALRQTLDKSRGLSGFLSRLSMVGLVLAVGVLLAVLSVMNGFERELEQRILGLAPHITIRGSASYDEWLALQTALEQTLPVTEQTLFHERDVLILRGNKAAPGKLLGLPDTALSRWSPMLLNAPDTIQANGIWLGQAIARRLGISVGDTLRLIFPDANLGFDQRRPPKQLSSRVAAIIGTGTELDEGLILAGFDFVAEAGGLVKAANGLAVQLNNVADAPRIRWQLMQTLDKQFFATDWTSMHGNLYTAIQLSRDLISLLLFSIIAVAAFNVVSSMILVVKDRQATIAMLRAMGASTRDISFIYLLQGGFIGVVGASLGLISGVLLAWLVPQLAQLIEQALGIQLLSTDVYPLAFVPVDIRGTDAVVLWSVSVLLCLLASVIPARRAAQISVAEVLAQHGHG